MALQDAPLRDPGEVTSASEWRTGSKEGFVIELPSGKKARVKRSLNLATMLEKGKIPNPLAGLIRQQIATRSSLPQINEDNVEAVPQLLELVAKMTVRNFVEPRVEVQPEDWDEDDDGEWEPSEGAIALEDIDLSDRMFAFAFAQGAALDLEQFRRQQAEAMANLQNGGAVEENSSGVAVPDRPVPGVLPERGVLDVREPSGTPDVGSGAEPGQASGEGSGTPAGADEGAVPTGTFTTGNVGEVTIFQDPVRST